MSGLPDTAASSDGLRRFFRPRPERPAEACDLCGAAVDGAHGHLVEAETRRLLCACRPCALLFDRPNDGARYRIVPERVVALGEGAVTPADWDALQIPVGVAFFFLPSSVGRMTGFYPGAAGAAECLLPLDAWSAIASRTPAAAALRPDVEALLARRIESGRFRAFVAPIDRCYELVGRIRRRWRGFDGGEEARAEIDAFFDRLERGAERAIAPEEAR